MRYATETDRDRIEAFLVALRARLACARYVVPADPRAAAARRGKVSAYREVIADLENILAGGNVPHRFRTKHKIQHVRNGEPPCASAP